MLFFFSFKGFKALKPGAVQERVISSPAVPAVRVGGPGGERRQVPNQAQAACTDLLLPETAGQLPRSPHARYPGGKGREEQQIPRETQIQGICLPIQ